MLEVSAGKAWKTTGIVVPLLVLAGLVAAPPAHAAAAVAVTPQAVRANVAHAAPGLRAKAFASVASVAAAALPTYTLADLTTHNIAANCWVAISGSVYDLTAFLSVHSGGPSRITPVCGLDGTTTFTGKHGAVGSSSNTSHTSTLAAYLIGTLAVAPAAPTGLTATAGNSQVALSWTGVTGATSYQVFQGATQVATPTGTTYTVTGLANNTAYTFTVKAVSAGGTSAASASASATPVAPIAAPAAPTGLTATAGNAQVSLSWTASTGATSYQVFQGATQLGTVTAPTVTYLATSLVNNTAYTFTVKAVNAGGTSAASASASATPVAPPVAPTGLTATPGNAQVSLSWTASTGATSYQVFQGATQLATVTAPTVTYLATSLVNNTAYTFTVKAINAGGTSAASASASATPVAPVVIPAAPTGLTATPGNAQVTLSWTASTGATSYQVLQGATQLATVTAPTVTYLATSLVNNTAYTFTVKAVNSAGTSAASTSATATPVAPLVAPATPTGLAATPGNTQVVLTWNAVTGATSYQILRDGTQIGTSASPTYTATSLTNNTSYAFTVKAVNSVGTSAASAVVNATPVAPVVIPAPPTGLAATAGNAQVSLSWTASSGATSYQVFRDGTQVATPSGTSYTVTSLVNNTSYSFTVTAVNSAGTSAPSAAASATPVAPVVIPAAPTGLTATAGNAQVSLSWTASSGATSYRVFRDGTQVATPSGTSYTVTSLVNNTSYTFTVAAVNSAGASAPCTSASATPVAPIVTPAPPTGLTATAGNSQVSLSWTASTGATSYVVLQGATQVATPTGTAFTVTGLANSTAYTFTVKAVNSAGTSAASSPASATPVAPSTPYTSTEVAAHATLASCWVIISGNVYDLTTFAADHSGGASQIQPVCGKDGTSRFLGQHGSAVDSHLAVLAPSQIGVLSGPPAATPAPGSYTLAEVGAHSQAGDCWVGIKGNVYDLTVFLTTHSGGAGAISGVCGTDATTTFYNRHGSTADGKLGILSAYLKGALQGYVAGSLPSQAAEPTVEAISGSGEYTMDDVAAHSSAGDCWSAIGGVVYGLSTWIPVHPGGSAVVAAMCGTDGTVAYAGKHGNSASAGAILGKLRLGTVVAAHAAPAAAVTFTLAEVAAHKTAADCWSVVNGVVYNLTNWVKQHPGGAAVITAMCGTDGTAMYMGKHGSSAGAKGALDLMKVGALADATGAAAGATGQATGVPTALTLQAVRQHTTAADCWTVVNRNVYDLTPWIKRHRGDDSAITRMCGRNATRAFNRTHGGPVKANKVLKRYLVGRVGTTAAVPAPATPAAAPAAKTYTMADVKAHATTASCWSVVNGGVYDLTTWIGQHPGGPAVIKGMCGNDSTSSFQGMHGTSGSAKAALGKLRIGTIA